MKEYLAHWQFWLSVVVVALVVNWAFAMWAGRKGQLV